MGITKAHVGDNWQQVGASLRLRGRDANPPNLIIQIITPRKRRAEIRRQARRFLKRYKRRLR